MTWLPSAHALHVRESLKKCRNWCIHYPVYPVELVYPVQIIHGPAWTRNVFLPGWQIPDLLLLPKHFLVRGKQKLKAICEIKKQSHKKTRNVIFSMKLMTPCFFFFFFWNWKNSHSRYIGTQKRRFHLLNLDWYPTSWIKFPPASLVLPNRFKLWCVWAI